MGELHNFRVVILASGDRDTGEGGSTMEAVVRAGALGLIAVEVGLVICNNSERLVPQVYERVRNLNNEFGLDIEIRKINGATHPAKEDEEVVPGVQTAAEAEACAEALEESRAHLFLLAGYMKKVGNLCRDGLNSHSGPLPLTEGKHGIEIQELVLEKKHPFSAHTVHEVDSSYDTGTVINWRPVFVRPDDTAKTLQDRVKEVEQACLPGDVESYLLRNYKQAV